MRHLPALPLIPIFLAMLACVVSAETSPTPAPNAGTGLEGTITISPITGGPIRIGAPNSKPLPNTAFEVKQDDRVVVSFTTDAEGKFRIPLPPGKYTVAKAGPGRRIGRFGPFPVEVAAGKMTSVEWNCDSGMR